MAAIVTHFMCNANAEVLTKKENIGVDLKLQVLKLNILNLNGSHRFSYHVMKIVVAKN
jgi:hypothetical protein